MSARMCTALPPVKPLFQTRELVPLARADWHNATSRAMQRERVAQIGGEREVDQHRVPWSFRQ